MRRFWKELGLGDRLMSGIALLAAVYAASFFYVKLFPVAQALSVIFFALMLADLFLLFQSARPVSGERELPAVLSLSDQNPVKCRIVNHQAINWNVKCYDELPYQLQRRDFEHLTSIGAEERETFDYTIRPTERGEYEFGHLRVNLQSPIGIFSRTLSLARPATSAVYPSIIQMKEFELRAFSRISVQEGIKRLRRAGVSYEFEQISPYVQGDDLRHINWKAAARRQELMVNRFESERSQPVYCIICKNREMLMPFHGLTLMDYAINTSLAISNVALLKYDKIGLITFSDRIGSSLRASRERQQLKRIMNALYKEKEREKEADYALLSKSLRSLAPNRSLLFLFIHFESHFALERALPHLKAISARHLLVVVFFRNTEIESFTKSRAKDVKGIYTRTLAQRMINEKESMFLRLRELGIQAILTEPEKLSMHTVDKYLELKARGLF